MRGTKIMLAIVAATGVAFAAAQDGKAPKAPEPKAPAAPPEMPPEMAALMEKYMKAATPGPEHKHLAKAVGTWEGKVKSWMSADGPPSESVCTTKITTMLGGRFTKGETAGDMPGMGPFEGFGLYGFDNVSRKYTSIWIDNMGTGMMIGTGELAADGKTMNWTLKANDPATGTETAWREVERWTGDHSFTMEMFGPDPMTRKEMKMLQIDYTRKSDGAPAPKGGGASKEPSK